MIKEVAESEFEVVLGGNLYVLAQAKLIESLTDRARLLGAVFDQFDLERYMGCAIAEVYSDWFAAQKKISESEFTYFIKDKNGPKVLFEILFPDKDLDQFILANLSEDRVSVINIELNSQIKELISRKDGTAA